MSIRSGSEKPPGRSVNRPRYRRQFLVATHRLIGLGYARILPQQLANSEEEIITQRLVNAINELIVSNNAEPWMRWYYAVDDRAVTIPGKEGKRRPWVDIEF